MPETVERDPGDARPLHEAPEFLREVARVHRLAIIPGELQAVIGVARAQLQVILELGNLVGSKRPDRDRRECDRAPAPARLRRLGADAVAGLLKDLPHAQGGAVEIDVTPPQSEDLAAAETSRRRQENRGE